MASSKIPLASESPCQKPQAVSELHNFISLTDSTMSHNSSSSESDSESISASTTHPVPHSLEQQIAHAFTMGHVLDAPELMKVHKSMISSSLSN